jgi:hypothetical protein
MRDLACSMPQPDPPAPSQTRHGLLIAAVPQWIRRDIVSAAVWGQYLLLQAGLQMEIGNIERENSDEC